MNSKKQNHVAISNVAAQVLKEEASKLLETGIKMSLGAIASKAIIAQYKEA